MMKLPVEDDAKPLPRQRVVSAHEVVQLEAAVFADRLQ
jgi:hypothetical protein